MRSDNVTKGSERAPNRSLFYALGYTPEELDFAKKLAATYSSNQAVPGTGSRMQADYARKIRALQQTSGHAMNDFLLPYFTGEAFRAGSTDVGDVSWVCPLAQINGTTMPADTAMHTWQMVSVGKSPMAKKGMLFAGRAMAACGIDCLEDPDILRRAKEEKDRRTGGRSYDPPIPPEVMPRIPKENA